MNRPDLRTCARRAALGLALAAAAWLPLAASAQDRFIVMASTTSTEQSGLFPTEHNLTRLAAAKAKYPGQF